VGKKEERRRGVGLRSRRPNFSQEEADVLVREVQCPNIWNCEQPSGADAAKVAWEEVTNISQVEFPVTRDNRLWSVTGQSI